MGPHRASRFLNAKIATVAALVALPASALAADRAVTADGPSAPRSSERGPRDLDVRDRGRAVKPAARTRRAQRRLRRSLGRRGILQLDGETGTPALVARLDGFLTPRRGGDAAELALRYLRSNAAAFGLDRDDLAGLRIKRRATTRRGLTRIEWEQVYRGVPAFENVVRANVSRGRLVNVSGAPEPDLAVPSTRPSLSAPDAVERALRGVGVRRQVRTVRTARDGTRLLGGGNRAKLVLFVDGGRPRLAWSTIARASADGVYRAVLDANTGELLKRTNLVAHATVHARDYTPVAPSGNAVLPRNAPTTGTDPWVTQNTLKGDNAWAYSDADDDLYEPLLRTDTPAAGDEVPPSSGSGADAVWNYPQATAFPAGSQCPASGCTWDGRSPLDTAVFTAGNNWQNNREQAATQAFYFVNNFHDHTQNDPNIDFSDAWGNFEQTASVTGAIAGDPMHTQVDDGAATASANFPDADHINNASMVALDEIPGDPYNSPLMTLFLWGPEPGPIPDFNEVNGADEGAIVYHEFIHGLTQRLQDPDGSGDLFTVQGGAMGEAWSDWYAMDYLNAQGFQPDPAGPNIDYGDYVGQPLSYQDLDCTVGLSSGACSAPPGGAGAGGFTYGDFGRINTDGGIPAPEVHADGEIWAQTLWDLRRSLIAAHGTAVGVAHARALVTDALRLSPTDPDFLDMRNSILQADRANGLGDCQRIWAVFAARGMGVDASTLGAGDPSPTQGFTPGGCGGGSSTTPPANPPTNPVLLLPAKADLSAIPRSIRVDRRGRFRLRFRGTPKLAGAATLRTVYRVRTSARRRLRVARKSFTVPDLGRVTLRLRLSRRNLRILKLNRRYRVRVTVELRNILGKSTATRRFTLKAPRPRR